MAVCTFAGSGRATVRRICWSVAGGQILSAHRVSQGKNGRLVGWEKCFSWFNSDMCAPPDCQQVLFAAGDRSASMMMTGVPSGWRLNGALRGKLCAWPGWCSTAAWGTCLPGPEQSLTEVVALEGGKERGQNSVCASC